MQEDGPTETVQLTETGDCAAAHAGKAIDKPVARCHHGGAPCFRCLAPKDRWGDIDFLATVRKRNTAYQLCANHIDIRRILPTLSDKEPYNCPHCGIPVTPELEKKEADELENAPPSKRVLILREHAKKHAGALRGQMLVTLMDHKFRSRGLLHRRLNIVSNSIAATFLALPLVEQQRIAANALLQRCNVLWRFPEKQSKSTRPKPIRAGNDARIFLTSDTLLTGLFAIFFGDARTTAARVNDNWAQLQSHLGPLGDAAAANSSVRPLPRGQAHAAGATPRDASAAASTPAAANPRKRPKTTLAITVDGDANAPDADDVATYTSARMQHMDPSAMGVRALKVKLREMGKSTQGNKDALLARLMAALQGQEVQARCEGQVRTSGGRRGHGPLGDDDGDDGADGDDEGEAPAEEEDDSLDLDDPDMDTLPEDEVVGGLMVRTPCHGRRVGTHLCCSLPKEGWSPVAPPVKIIIHCAVHGSQTAIEVWMTAIKYTGDLHSQIDNHFDLIARRAHADRCQASGRAWALAINGHTSNKSWWQYVHDAFAHVHEDIMEHGAGDRNDDGILETKNKRKKKWARTTTFRCVIPRPACVHSWPWYLRSMQLSEIIVMRRGGTNEMVDVPDADGLTHKEKVKWTQTYRVEERGQDGQKTGEWRVTARKRAAPDGEAAQVQRMDLIASIYEGRRTTLQEARSAAQQQTQAAKKEERAQLRAGGESALTDLRDACAITGEEP